MALPTDDLTPKPGWNPDLPDTPWESVDVEELYQDWLYEEYNSEYGDDWISTREAAYQLGNSTEPSSSFSAPTRCIKNDGDSAELIETNTQIRSGNYTDRQCVKYKDLIPRGYIPVTFQLGDPTVDINVSRLTGYFTVGGRRVNKVYSKMSTSSQACGIAFKYNDVTYIQYESLEGTSSAKRYSNVPSEIVVYVYYSDGSKQKYTSITVKGSTYAHRVTADTIDTRKSWHHGSGVVFMPISKSNIVSVKVGILFTTTETTDYDPDYSQCYLVKYYSNNGNIIDLSSRKSPFADLSFGGNFESYDVTNGAFWKFYGSSLPEKIEDTAFYGLSNLEYFPFQIYKLSADGRSKTIQTQTITSIGSFAFTGSGITRFIIPEAVKTLGESCCANCTKLTTVNFINGTKITVIPKNCFYGCSALTGCDLPSNTTEIGESAFNGCSKYDFSIPNKVVSIGIQSYQSCAQSSASWIPTSCISVNNGAFSQVNFTNTGTLYCMPVTVSTWGVSVYQGAIFHNQTIQLGNIRKIPDYTFASVWSINIGDSVSGNIDQTGTFTINFPITITEIGDFAFYGRQFGSIDLSRTNVTKLGKACFADNITATEIKLPNTLSTIGDCCFQRNYSCTSVSIPQSVTSIGDWAFLYLQNWYTGNKWCWASSIGERAFEINDPSFVRGETRRQAPDYVTGQIVDLPTHIDKEEHWWFPNITKLSYRMLHGRTVVECHAGRNCTSIGKEVIVKYKKPYRQWFFYSSTSTMAGDAGDKQLGMRSGAEFNLVSGAVANYQKNPAWDWYLTKYNTRTFDPYLNHLFIYCVQDPDNNSQFRQLIGYSPRWYRLDYQYVPDITIIHDGDKRGLSAFGGAKYSINSNGTQVTILSVPYGSDVRYKGTYKISTTWYFSTLSDRYGHEQNSGLPPDSVKKTSSMDLYTFQGYFYNIMTKV